MTKDKKVDSKEKIVKGSKVTKTTKTTKTPKSTKETKVHNPQDDVILKSIAKKYGNVITKLSEPGVCTIKTVSTGSISLDLALGRGGMALGRIYEAFGPHSSGKSTLGINVAIQAQRRGMQACYFDAEHAVDPKLFEAYGVDAAKLMLIQAYGGEDNLDILERLVKSNMADVCIVDSVSALLPKVEAEADIDKDHMALLARLMSKAMRKLTPIAAETGTLLIFVNQLRMKIGSYGGGVTTSGGEALSFYSTGRISIRGPEAKARRIADPVSGEIVGHIAAHEVVKNKLGEPFKKADLRLMYGKGYDYFWEVLDLANSLDIVQRAGAWYKYDGENIGQGEVNALDNIKKDAELFSKIRKEVISAVGLEEQYELHGNPGPIYSN